MTPTLRERIAALTGPDANLFREVANLLLPEPEPWTQAAVDHATIEAFLVAGAYLDALRALIERKRPGWAYACGTMGEQGIPWFTLTEPTGQCCDFLADHVLIEAAGLLALLDAMGGENE